MLSLFAAVALLASVHHAPTRMPSDIQPQHREMELGCFVGVSRHSLVGTHLGVTPDRSQLFVGVQLTATVVANRRVRFAYAPQLVPLVLVTNNPTYKTLQTSSGPLLMEGPRGTAFGLALAPISAETELRLGRMHFYGGGGVGVIWFDRAVPTRDARAFNYTFEFGGGLRWKVGSVHLLNVGYKFHHLSNAYTARENPGLDAAVVVVGYARAFGVRR